jgi:hypothetical protein
MNLNSEERGIAIGPEEDIEEGCNEDDEETEYIKVE